MIPQNSNISSVHRISIIKTDGQKEIIHSHTNQAQNNINIYNNPQIIKETKIITRTFNTSGSQRNSFNSNSNSNRIIK